MHVLGDLTSARASLIVISILSFDKTREQGLCREFDGLKKKKSVEIKEFCHFRHFQKLFLILPRSVFTHLLLEHVKFYRIASNIILHENAAC